MSSHETPQETGRGFALSSREARVIGGASVLMALNIVLMYVFVETPLAVVNDTLFQAPIVGVVVYGAAIMGGEIIAERGIEGENTGIAVVGTVILQLAFGVFGSGVLSAVQPEGRALVLGVTALIVAVMTALISGYVYAHSKTFESWATYANGAFIGGVIIVLVGTFFEPALLLGFGLFFLGFILRLGWEIWRIRDRRTMPVGLQTIGVYIAVAGVFVHVLQLVIRYGVSQK